jgi:hypothetical protein
VLSSLIESLSMVPKLAATHHDPGRNFGLATAFTSRLDADMSGIILTTDQWESQTSDFSAGAFDYALRMLQLLRGATGQNSQSDDSISTDEVGPKAKIYLG